MQLPLNKRFYKVISLLAKTLILFLSFWYIIYKIKSSSSVIDLYDLLSNSNFIFFIATCLLMPLNWGLEAFKWKTLIAPLENISFPKSLKSVLAGVTVSFFTPNRVGEFAGRIFFLEKADKIQATLKFFLGSISQFSITIFAGLIALFMYYKKGFNLIHSLAIFDVAVLKVMSIFIFFLLICLILMYKKKVVFSEKMQAYINILFEIKRTEFFKINTLSLIRYFVFSFQYYLVLLLFNIAIDFEIAFMLIALVFFISTAIPTFAFTEVVVRGATSVYFFSIVTNNNNAIVATSFVLWIINIAIPALIGSVFLWKVKLIKEN
jgi:hypothetical protein